MAIKLLGDNPVTGKIIVIGIIVLTLLIPLSMLRGLIRERMQMRDQAYATVAQGWGGKLTAGGPMLRIPFEIASKNKDGELAVAKKQLYVLPSELTFDVKITEEPEPRHVGIYRVPVYQARIKLRGRFDGARVKEAAKQAGVFQWPQAKLRLPLSDVRSVRELTLATFAEKSLEFAPAEAGVYSAIEAPVDLTATLDQPGAEFSIDIKLAGSEALALLPLAAVTRANVSSAWPHPQFTGAFLPADRAISNEGFTASWQVLELNRAFRQAWIDEQVGDAQLLSSAFGVELFQSIDVYQRSERAVKYALMFIALTFLSFYAWELLTATPLHPMQYLFVGLALSTFYLLLIALSEHIAFAAAYWLGAGALASLLAVYLAGALRDRRSGGAIASVMIAVYGVLYLLVLSENYALLMGAITLFAVLALVMLATRHVRWYAQP